MPSEALSPVMPPSPTPEPSEITRLLEAWGDGEGDALNRLVPLVYEQLRRMAHHRLRWEEASPTLNTTGLVHEAYLKLVELRQARFRDRGHFLAMVSRVMRRLLVDHARNRRAQKRGHGVKTEPLLDEHWISEPEAELVLELDEALQRLESLDPRQGRIVEERFFGGLTLEEIARAEGISLATVKRELRFARAWLAGQLGPAGDG
jgi:RNA polymerase sigma factor (TIGR02999 family)